MKKEKNETEIGKNLSDNIAHTLSIQDTHKADPCTHMEADKTVWNLFRFSLLYREVFSVELSQTYDKKVHEHNSLVMLI